MAMKGFEPTPLEAAGLRELVVRANTRLLLCAPFLGPGVLHFIARCVSERGASNKLSLELLTDPVACIVQAPRELAAGLDHLRQSAEEVGATLHVKLIRRLHAKLYAADEDVAWITSANLTEGALTRNLELSMRVENKKAVRGLVAQLAHARSAPAIPLSTWTNKLRTKKLARAWKAPSPTTFHAPEMKKFVLAAVSRTDTLLRSTRPQSFDELVAERVHGQHLAALREFRRALSKALGKSHDLHQVDRKDRRLALKANPRDPNAAARRGNLCTVRVKENVVVVRALVFPTRTANKAPRKDVRARGREHFDVSGAHRFTDKGPTQGASYREHVLEDGDDARTTVKVILHFARWRGLL